MTVKELRKSDAYKWHHTGSRRGYESRKGDGHIEPYKGRFGEGYIIISPRYYIKNLFTKQSRNRLIRAVLDRVATFQLTRQAEL